LAFNYGSGKMWRDSGAVIDHCLTMTTLHSFWSKLLRVVVKTAVSSIP